MPIAWFLSVYKRRTVLGGWPKYRRYPAMDDFTPAIYGEGGAWAESEVLGNYALVKVRASDATLATIAGTTGFHRIHNTRWLLNDSLSDLTVAQRNALNTRLLAMGYSQAEIDATMGTNLAAWRQRTLGDLLRLIATRRRRPRYDPDADELVFDGEVQACRAVESVDAEVTE